jgi:hypothetical protein
MFTEDTRTENFLRYIGVKYEYQDTMEVADLHDKWKTNNLGRGEAIDNDAVLEYGMLMEKGSPAPAVIVMRQREGIVVLDGVQRLSAAELSGSTKFSAYLVSPRTGVSKQHLIRIAANARINGQHTPDKNWIMATAVEVLYFDDDCSVEEISRAVGRSVKAVHEEIRHQKTVQKMESVGYVGTLSSRKKKWFSAEVGKYADESDWQLAPGPIKHMLDTFEQCKFRNGDASNLLEAFFDVKRSQKKDRHAQFTQKVADLKSAPEVRQKLKSDNKRSHLDKALPAMRALGTILQRALDADEIVHDGEYADELAGALRVIYSTVKSIVPRDLQYRQGRKSSIFDKG